MVPFGMSYYETADDLAIAGIVKIELGSTTLYLFRSITQLGRNSKYILHVLVGTVMLPVTLWPSSRVIHLALRLQNLRIARI